MIIVCVAVSVGVLHPTTKNASTQMDIVNKKTDLKRAVGVQVNPTTNDASTQTKNMETDLERAVGVQVSLTSTNEASTQTEKMEMGLERADEYEKETTDLKKTSNEKEKVAADKEIETNKGEIPSDEEEYKLETSDKEESEEMTCDGEEEEQPKKYYIGDYREEENDPDYDYIWTDSWDYGADPKYTGELGPNLPYKRYPTSYTPPGWMRLYKYRKVLKPSAKPKSLDVLFEF